MKKWILFLIALLVVGCDQASKFWAYHSLIAYQPLPLLPFMNLTLAFNTGAAFSFLSGAGGWHRWFFALFSSVMSIVIIIWIVRLSLKDTLQGLALALVLGGAIGNLIDRGLFGYVVDFIDLYYKNNHWPVFNLADTAICIGAFLLLIDLAKNSHR